MKLRENVTVAELLRQVRLCRDEVEFRTPEGDCLNLKSELSKYLFAVICEKRELMEQGTLICKNEEDRQALMAYFEEM